MLNLRPNVPRGRPLRLLFIGAHCDDIEIGCAGAVQQLLDEYPSARVHWLVLSSDSTRAGEARRSARMLLRRAQAPRVMIEGFRNSYFPSEMAAIKECFEALKKTVSPDIIFSHHGADLHQDHRIVSELTWNTFRDHMILEYEIPKYDGGLGSPALFVPLRRAQVRRKIDVLMRVFGSQRSKRWFSPDTFQGLMRLRGVECNAPEGHAEAFYVRKLVL